MRDPRQAARLLLGLPEPEVVPSVQPARMAGPPALSAQVTQLLGGRDVESFFAAQPVLEQTAVPLHPSRRARRLALSGDGRSLVAVVWPASSAPRPADPDRNPRPPSPDPDSIPPGTAMNNHNITDIKPELTVARTLDVRHAGKDLDAAAAHVAGLIRQWPGSLVNLTDHGHHGNRIHIKVESPGNGHEAA